MANSDSTDPRKIIRVLAVVAIGAVILAPFISIGLDLAGSQERIHPSQSQTTVLASRDLPNYVDVDATTGRTAVYTSDSSKTTFSATFNTSKTWSATTAVELSDDANLNATYTLIGYDYGNFSLHYSNGSYLAYANINGTDAVTTINAPNPRSLTTVSVHYNATSESLQIARDGTRQTPVQLTNTTSSRPVSQTLDGRLDELRLIQGNLTDSQLNRYANTPAASLPNADRRARIMWDHQGSSVNVYFASGDADVVDVSWGDGVPKPGLWRGSDYAVSGNPFQVTALSGGLIEGAPVAYVSWHGPFANIVYTIQSIGSSALTLVVVGLLAVAGRRAVNSIRW